MVYTPTLPKGYLTVVTTLCCAVIRYWCTDFYPTVYKVRHYSPSSSFLAVPQHIESRLERYPLVNPARLHQLPLPSQRYNPLVSPTRFAS